MLLVNVLDLIFIKLFLCLLDILNFRLTAIIKRNLFLEPICAISGSTEEFYRAQEC